MDQVRTILSWLKRQHFWVLCGLVALIALFCWWSASRKLSAMYDTNQKTITAQFGSLKQVRDTTFHPNQTIIERQEAEKKKQTDSVAKLWQQLYDKQRDQVLQWPAALNKAFRDAVDKLQFADEIPPELRDNYQNYIERHFPELPKKINARILEANAAGGPGGEFGRMPTYSLEGPGATGVMPDEGDYICEWLDQGVIREELNFPERPSSLRIWVTQEDLWVYHTLLDVIAKTNQAANATRMANAAVKIVYSLEVGARAAQYSRQPGRLLVQPAIAAVVPGMEGGPGGAGPEGGPAGPGGAPGGRPMMDGMMGGGMNNTQMSPAQEQNALLSWRYLDDKGAPISVGSAGGGGEAPAGPEGGAVDPAAAGPAPPVDLSLFGPGYKRLPIRMVLRMDARYLPQLITTCANQPLRVEVQEVRINSPDVAGLDANAGGMMGGMGGGMRSFEGGGRGGFGGAGGTSNLFADHSGIQNFPSQPNVVNVVIQGTIYVFNKPNLKLLEEPPATAEAPLASQ